MKYLTIFVMSMTVLLFAACSSGGGEPTGAPEATETKSALATAVSTTAPEATDEAYPANSPSALPVEPYPHQQSEAASDVATGSAYPSEVDLSDVTSEPGNGDPQVAPKPGVPNDTTAVVQSVSEDLAKRLGIDISEITAVETDAVEWFDSALGCPAEGFAYAQVITPGIFIALEASGQPYNYHADLNGNFVLCGENGAPVIE
jgi:hypothetical protein